MTSLWRKVLSDFASERTRTGLVVLAIAVGIAGFEAVLASYAILTRELDRGYLDTNPASATLRVDGLDDELVAAVRADPGISDAEPRRAVSGRIKAGPAAWRNLMLFVVKDYADIRVSKLVPEQGAWPPAAGEILIERDALQVARAQIGDTVTITTPQGKEQTLRLSGTVHDVGQAQARMENIVYGYITLATLEQLGEQPTLDQLKILVATNRFDEPHVRAVTDSVKALIEARGKTVRRVDIPAPGQHPHTAIMGMLLLAMASFGLFVLVLSGVLVVNLLTALMAAQIRQIGVMKAIGATRMQIARIYFGQALLLGGAATLVALPAGLWGSRVLCRYQAVFLNFDIASFAVPLWVFALVAFAGVLVPLLAAAYPVWKGSAVSVHRALTDRGVASSSFGTTALDRALASVGGLARPVLLAIRNSFRKRARLVLTIVTMAVGGVFFMAAFNVRASLIRTLDRLFATKKSDLSITLATMSSFDPVERAIRNTPGIVRGEGWIATEASFPVVAGAAPVAAPPSGHAPPGHVSGGTALHGGAAITGDRFTAVGIPIGSDFIALDIVAGRGIEAGDVEALVVNSALAEKAPQMRVGNTVRLCMGPSELDWQVVGVAREPFSPPMIYVPREFFEQRGGHFGMANTVRLKLDQTDADAIAAVRASFDRNLEHEGLRALSSSTKAESRYGFDQHMLMIYVFLIVMACIIGGVGGLGLATTSSLNVLERRAEMGVLRAIGASPAIIWLIVVTEGVVMGVLSWALAALAAWPVSKMVGNVLAEKMFKGGIEFAFDPRGLVIWFSACIVVGAMASFVPAWHASRCSVREAIAHE